MKIGAPEIMRAVGEAHLAQARDRILSGEGTDGELPDLSPRYAKQRGEYTRTLQDTGAMLESRAVGETTDTRADLVFENSQIVKAAVNEARTPFLWPTEEEQEALAEHAGELLQKQVFDQAQSLVQELNSGG